MSYELCDCGEHYYNDDLYSSCYECYLERSEGYVSCIFCGRWHSERFDTCFQCRWTSADRVEAARNLRQYIMWRDNYQCQDCGTHEDLQVNHIYPCRRGGDANPWNLQVLCSECNRFKGDEWIPKGRWDRRRRELLTQYFYWWRPWLDDDQRAWLRDEIEAMMWPRKCIINTEPVDLDDYLTRHPEDTHLLT